MDFKTEYEKRYNYVQNMLESFLPEEEGHQKIMFEAMNYSIRVGGKRLRPIFVYELYRIFQLKAGMKEEDIDFARIEPFMAAIEMIHTYSLVHDDLPAMDNDDLRRGHPTTHKKFGHAMGILAGDSLLNYAMETACKAFADGVYGSEQVYDDLADEEWNRRVAQAMKVFFTRSGVYGMIGGQTVDVLKNGENLSEDEIEFIYQLKTCALISASILAGAILGGAKTRDVEVLEPLGYYIGMAFQIKDDILDITADEAVLGKPVGSDERNGKVTYVTLHGMKGAEEKVREYTDKAAEIAKSLGDSEFLTELILSLLERNK